MIVAQYVCIHLHSSLRSGVILKWSHKKQYSIKVKMAAILRERSSKKFKLLGYFIKVDDVEEVFGRASGSRTWSREIKLRHRF